MILEREHQFQWPDPEACALSSQNKDFVTE